MRGLNTMKKFAPNKTYTVRNEKNAPLGTVFILERTPRKVKYTDETRQKRFTAPIYESKRAEQFYHNGLTVKATS